MRSLCSLRLLLWCIPASLCVLLGQCDAQVVASTGAAPLYVALVNVSELATIPSYVAVAPRSAAAAWRSAGYPTAPFLSKPPLPRSRDAEQAPPAPVFDIAQAVPVGPGGPTLEPLVTNSMQSRLRRLQQGRSNRRGPAAGFTGTSIPAAGYTSALAAGPKHILQAAGPVITITNITSSGDPVPETKLPVALSALMAGAAADCEDVYDPAALFDQAAGRFLVSATCGGQGRVLLASSATSDPRSTWFVYGLVADGVNTSLACMSPTKESTLVDYTQVGYNADGVFVTYKSICPSSSSNSGVGILALPKYAIYKGMPNFLYPMYTSGELQKALPAAYQNSRCAQMAPVVPQGPEDVPVGATYFVCKDLATSSSDRQQIIVAALVDTAMLWQWGGADSRTSTPLLTAQRVSLGHSTSPLSSISVQQPEGLPPVQLDQQTRGLWQGGAVLAHGGLYLATSTAVVYSPNTADTGLPSIIWTQLSVSSSVSGADSCPQSQAGATARAAFDWLRDYSWNWGAEFDLNYTQHANATFASRLKSTASVSGRSSHSVIKAAGLPLLGAAKLGAFTAGTWALYGGEPCTCYRCYWGGAYYRYGGYNGGALAGLGFGYASTGYYFNQGQMTRCQSTCTRCWYYGYPGYGFGNVGDDLVNPIPDLALRIRSIQGQLTPSSGHGLAEPSLAANNLTMRSVSGVDFATLFTPCNRSASLDVRIVRQGLISRTGKWSVGLVSPAIGVSEEGKILLVYSYAGSRNVSQGLPAYLGVGASIIPAAGDQGNFMVVKAGQGGVLPAVPLGLSAFYVRTSESAAIDWPGTSAATLHAASGKVLTAAHYAEAGTTTDQLQNTVGTWISTWVL